jgi:hypothetical protein
MCTLYPPVNYIGATERETDAIERNRKLKGCQVTYRSGV